MHSTNYVIIQLALRPMKVLCFAGTTFSATTVLDFGEFFSTMAKLTITPETTVIVNRGPGSYSGIRTGISYMCGLLHGGMITSSQIRSCTSFDLVRTATNHKGAIYLKAWPRLASGKLEGSKGYWSAASQNNQEFLYKTWAEISNMPDLLSIGEESIKTKYEYRTFADILEDPVTFRELVDSESVLSTSLEPLYINPVHIS